MKKFIYSSESLILCFCETFIFSMKSPGVTLNFSLSLCPSNTVKIVLYDCPVTYYIFGGFVFLPLSRPYLRSEYGSKWSSKCAVKLKDLYFNGYKEEEDQEVVLLSRVLASDWNVGYHKFTNCILEQANGVEIKNVRHLITVIESSDSKFVQFTFSHNVTMVLERDIAVKGMPAIMAEHKIKFDRSENLRTDSKLKQDAKKEVAKEQEKEMQTDDSKVVDSMDVDDSNRGGSAENAD